MAAATAIIDLIITDPDVAVGLVGMPSYMLSMTAFACMFLIKVAIKYGGDLIERRHVQDLTTGLVRQFRSLSAGKWHLANLMVGGLERMLSTLNTTTAPGQVPLPPNGVPMGPGMVPENVDVSGQMMQGDRPFTEIDGDLFFDYDMSFGLSPVFRFDPGMFAIDGSGQPIPGYPEAEYGMRP